MTATVKARRSLTKAITFRCLILMSDAVVVFFVTHRFDITFSVVIATNVASTVLFFIHERIWNKVQWGRAEVPTATHTPL